MSKRIITIVSILLALLMLVACGSQPSAPEADTSEPAAAAEPAQTDAAEPAAAEEPEEVIEPIIVNIASNESGRTLDPGMFTDTGSETLIRMSLEPLIYTDHTGTGYQPLLAESWDIDPEGMYWIFHLREGVKWHNGDPFTADDVVFTFQRLLDSNGDLVWLTTNLPLLDSVEKIDDFTVQMNFSEPCPLAGHGIRSAYIISKKAYEELGDDYFNLQYMYGTGPWIFDEWIDGQYTHYTKNPDYWNKENYDPNVSEVYIRELLEPYAAVSAQISGDIDVYAPSGGIDEDLLGLYAGTEQTIELVELVTTATSYLGFQYKDDHIFNDINVRRAFSLAIDRQLIIDSILGGKGALTHGFFSENVIGYDPTLPTSEYNPELAKQLLEESDYNGETLTILTATMMPKASDLLLTYADMAEAVGFNVEIAVETMSVFNEKRNSSNYDLIAIVCNFTDGNIQRHLNTIINDSYFQNFYDEEMFDLINKFNVEMDPDLRNEYAKQINARKTEIVGPMIPIAHPVYTYARNYGIIGVDFYPDGLRNYSYVDYDPSLLK